MLTAGHALNEAKELCPHGQWLDWLQGTNLSERTAQRYMTLAASGLKPDFVTDLGGIAAALKFISLRKTAMRHFDNAKAAAIRFDKTGEGKDDLAPPVEWAMHAIEQMVAMLPSVNGRAGQ